MTTGKWLLLLLIVGVALVVHALLRFDPKRWRSADNLLGCIAEAILGVLCIAIAIGAGLVHVFLS